jgi:threonine dehydratase
MPVNAPLSKIEATEGYGGKVLLHGLTYDEAYEKALKLRDSHGYTLVHAFNNRNIIAGQGTIGLELLEDLPEVEVVIVPVGGGGLISGCAVALHGEKPELQVFGIEPAGAASMKRSLDRGVPTALQKVSTIADGIAVKRPGELTFELVREHVARTVEVEDSAIAHAMTLLLERSKLVVEGAGAAGVAALVAEKLELKGRKVAVVLSGGNVDLNMLSQVVARGLGAAGRYLRFFTDMPDRPGALSALLKLVAELEANVVSVEHERLHSRVELGRTGVDILVETRSYAHRQKLLDKLVGEGYDVRVVDIVPPQDKLNRQC